MNRKEQIIRILTELRPEFDFTQENVDFFEEGMLDSFDLVALVSVLLGGWNLHFAQKERG